MCTTYVRITFLANFRKLGGSKSKAVKKKYGTFLQQLECGYEFPALIHVWIASAGVLEWFISTRGEDLDLSLHSLLE
jgi:hypothetical protein